jgi:hypothetical protein
MVIGCPHCGNRFYVPDERAGQIVSCHKCKKPVQAPAKAVRSIDNVPAVMDGQGDIAPKTQAVKRINLRAGFRRLTFMVSVLAGFVLFITTVVEDGYTLNDYLASVREICTFGGYRGGTIGVFLDFLIPWVTGFAGVWVAYAMVSFIVAGFTNTEVVSEEREQETD